MAPGVVTPETHLSILESLRNRYGPTDRIRLDVTYRMNDGICAFPSHTWYDDELHPAPEVAGARLELEGLRRDDLLDRLLDPSQPVALLLLNHRGCAQTSELEWSLRVASGYRSSYDPPNGLPMSRAAAACWAGGLTDEDATHFLWLVPPS